MVLPCAALLEHTSNPNECTQATVNMGPVLLHAPTLMEIWDVLPSCVPCWLIAICDRMLVSSAFASTRTMPRYIRHTVYIITWHTVMLLLQTGSSLARHEERKQSKHAMQQHHMHIDSPCIMLDSQLTISLTHSFVSGPATLEWPGPQFSKRDCIMGTKYKRHALLSTVNTVVNVLH